MKNKVIIITGPTATGKTSLGISIARHFNGEIISADSRQVYKGLDLGTGKDLEDYTIGGSNVKHHLIDIVSPMEEYNLKEFYTDANKKIKEIIDQKKQPLIVGGTVLYIDSLISSYKFPIAPPNQTLRDNIEHKSAEEIADYLKTNYPEEYEKIDLKKSKPRLTRALEKVLITKNADTHNTYDKNDYLIIGTYFPRLDTHARIEKRLDQRLSEGMIEEVKQLHDNGVTWERLERFGLEYRYISFYLQNKISFDEMRETLFARIRRLARRQDIWFRKLEAAGHKIHWLKEGNCEQAFSLIEKFLNNKALPEPEIKLSNIHYGKKTQ
ncbi:MAG: tRNA (adenosine(37)-N6)-dimethylallyltransferase MiaA [bacterium]|nr:tRNA (adenosine(37)-N6)-dimethylallyltransferase MiaA [bacterium]